jgi:hypothetical protein
MTSPVLAAEWLSGQLRELIARSAGFVATSEALLGQLEQRGEDLLVSEGGLVAIRDPEYHIRMLGTISLMIDYDAGPSEL